MADLYQTLGVPKGATKQQIKKSYRKLAGELHPDKNPGPEGEERFKHVTAAYEVLRDDTRRKNYDEFGEVSLRAGFDAAQARAAKSFGGGGGHFDLGDLFGGGAESVHAGGGGFGDALGDLFRRSRGGPGNPGGGGGHHFPGQQPGRRPGQRGSDTKSNVKISFRDAVLGTTLKLSPSGGGAPITVRIPPGAAAGTRVRVRGKGAAGFGGAPAGDLLLNIEVLPHPFFTRDGDSLHIDVPLNLSEAHSGGAVAVPTPHGEVKLTVPKGVQSGQKVRLRGKGVQRDGKSAGDLYVRFLVLYPTDDITEVNEAIETLKLFEANPREDLSF